MTDDIWNEGSAHALAVRIAGAASELIDESGQPAQDNSILMLFNSSDDPVDFKLPQTDSRTTAWSRLLDSADQSLTSGTARGTYKVQGRSVVVLADLTRQQRRAEARG
jgi:pullulanase/glycogen debranching enzyme